MPELAKDIEFLAQEAGKHCKKFILNLNEALSTYSPVEIIIVTLATMIVLNFICEKLENIRKVGFKTMLFRFIAKLPIVRGKVAAEGEKIWKEYSEKYSAQRKGAIKVLPQKPLSHDEIMKRINDGEI
jgi:hypothetical protein